MRPKHRNDFKDAKRRSRGYEYQAPRPGNICGGSVPGRFSKTRTHRLERRAARRECWTEEVPFVQRSEIIKPKVNLSYRGTISENRVDHFSDEFWSVKEELDIEARYREWEDIDSEMLDYEAQMEREYQELLDWEEIERLERINQFYCDEEDCI